VHGITNEFLQDKPRFADVVEDLIAFVRGSELVIHNAPFDVGFLNHELNLLGGGWLPVDGICGVLDTLTVARRLHPGQKNNLDALCKRYGIDNSQRDKHGALLDAEILADVYLAMTGGQVALSLGSTEAVQRESDSSARALDPDRPPLRVVRAAGHELAEHAKRLEAIDGASNGGCVWKKLDW